MDGRFDKAVRDMLSLEDEAVLLTSAADLVLQEYVLSAPAMSAKHFGLFCRTFARLAPRSQDITYQAAEAALARENGCTVLRMDTNAKNAAARRLYLKLGYAEPDIVPCIFNGIPNVQLVLLEKKLT